MHYNNYLRRFYIYRRLNKSLFKKYKMFYAYFIFKFFKYLYKNTNLFIKNKTSLFTYFNLKKKKYYITQKNNLCIKSGKSRGVIKHTQLSRQNHRYYLNKGYLQYINNNNNFMLNFIINWTLINVVFIYLYYNYLDDDIIIDLCYITILVEFLFSILNVSYIFYTDSIYINFQYSLFNNINLIKFDILFIFDEISSLFYIILLVALSCCFYFLIEYFQYDFNNKSIILLSVFFSNTALMYFISYDLISLIFFWELISLVSFFLIQYWSYRLITYKAGLKVFIISQLGDLPFFFFIFFLINKYNTTSILNINSFFLLNNFSILKINNIIIKFNDLLAILGIFSLLLKSAQFIFYPWLLDAMEAPVPISAQLHSSTLVIIGFYVYFRFINIFSISIIVNNLISILGFITIIWASTLAFYQNDGKKLLACSTASQLGYIVLSLGLGLYKEGIYLLTFCCLNKAVTFIWFGNIMNSNNGLSDFRFISSLNIFKQLNHSGFFYSIMNFTIIPGAFSWQIKSTYMVNYFFFSKTNLTLFCILTLTWFFSSLYLIYYYIVLFLKNNKELKIVNIYYNVYFNNIFFFFKKKKIIISFSFLFFIYLTNVALLNNNWLGFFFLFDFLNFKYYNVLNNILLLLLC